MTSKNGFASTRFEKFLHFVLPADESSPRSFLHKFILPWMFLFKLCGCNPMTDHVKNGKLCLNKFPTYIFLAYSALVFFGASLKSGLTFATEARKIHSAAPLSLTDIVDKTIQILQTLIGPCFAIIFSRTTSKITRLLFHWKDSPNSQLTSWEKSVLVTFIAVLVIIAAFFTTSILLQYIPHVILLPHQYEKDFGKVVTQFASALLAFSTVVMSVSTNFTTSVFTLGLTVYLIICFNATNKRITECDSNNRMAFRKCVEQHAELSKLTVEVGEILSPYMIVLYSMDTLLLITLTSMIKNNKLVVAIFGTSYVQSLGMLSVVLHLILMTFCCVLLSDKVKRKNSKIT